MDLAPDPGLETRAGLAGGPVGDGGIFTPQRIGSSVQDLPGPSADHKMLWSGSPGRPGGGLCFHQVIEKEGVAFRRMVYILVIIGSPGGKPPEGQSHNDRPRLISGPMLIRMVASEFGKASMIFWSTRQIGVNSGFAPKRA